MANKISIALTSRKSIDFKLPQWQELSDIKLVATWLSNFLENNLLIISTAFLLLMPSINVSGRPGTMVILYAITLLALLNRILRKMFFKGEHFPSVPLDLALLTLTTFISFSFFYNTAVVQVNTNIWGGKPLQEISGVSLITYWFYYYLLFSSIRTKEALRKLLMAIYASPIIAILGALIFNLQLGYTSFIVIILLQPMYLYLSLNSKKNSKLHLLNLFISTFFIISDVPKWSLFILFVFYLLLLIYMIIAGRKELPQLFRNLDKGFSFKGIASYIKANSTIFLMLLSLIFIFIGSNSFYNTITENDYLALENGYGQVLKLSGLESILGIGLKVVESPRFVQFILSYGLLAGLAFVFVLYLLFKEIKKIFRSSKNVSITKLLTSFVIALLTLSGFLLVSTSDAQIIPIEIITMGTVVLLIKRIMIDGMESPVTFELLNSKGSKANQSFFLKVMKSLLIIIFLLVFIYLLSYLNYINIFINT